MGHRRAQGRNISGILLLDKPMGLSSNAALQRVKRLYRAAKAGHTGSLDPLATGLLPVCLGTATKISAFLLDADKRYRVRIRLGEVTSTADAEGEVIRTAPTDGVTETALRTALAGFLGTISQLPPMYSAVKHQGERLYKLARQGVEVERQPREVTIFAVRLLDFALPEVEIEVHCSKGTYVRTLAEDLGEVLGCGGHVVGLRRTGVGPYIEGERAFVTMDQLEAMCEQDAGVSPGAVPESLAASPETAPASAACRPSLAAIDALLLPQDSALAHWPEVRLSEDACFYLRQGQAVLVPRAPTEGLVRLYDPSRRFIGIGEILDDGLVQPKRLF